MSVSTITAQLRTTNLDESIEFYVSRLGFELDFRYQDFYAGIKAADGQSFHLKLVDVTDPSIEFVREGGHLHLFFSTNDVDGDAARLARNGVEFHAEIADTAWGTREFYVRDDQGHILCFAQPGTG